MEIKQTFAAAINDYQYLLNRNYPQKSILKIIGDKYQLSSTERSILYRGICSSTQIKHRRSRAFTQKKLKKYKLHIDAYNVLLVIGSYLNGSLVFLSNDGFLRDASELHGRIFRKEIMNKAVEILFTYLQSNLPAEIHFYIDEPISLSGKLAHHLQLQIHNLHVNGEAKTIKSPDLLLKNIMEGVIATADSIVIDHARQFVIDLPKRVLDSQFSPKFLDLTKIL